MFCCFHISEFLVSRLEVRLRTSFGCVSGVGKQPERRGSMLLKHSKYDGAGVFSPFHIYIYIYIYIYISARQQHAQCLLPMVCVCNLYA